MDKFFYTIQFLNVFDIKNVKKRLKIKTFIANIRNLSNLLVHDAYVLFVQTEIIINLQNCIHIAILDATFFLSMACTFFISVHAYNGHLWKKQKTFNVSIINCMNNTVYVQRQINIILRPLKQYAKTYINDIVFETNFFEKRVVKFRIIFKLLVSYNISIKSEFFVKIFKRRIFRTCLFFGFTNIFIQVFYYGRKSRAFFRIDRIFTIEYAFLCKINSIFCKFSRFWCSNQLLSLDHKKFFTI